MEQFKLFSVARRMVAIIHGQHILYARTQRSNIYTLLNICIGQGEHILNSRNTVANL